MIKRGEAGVTLFETKTKTEGTQLKKRVKALKFDMAVALERYNVLWNYKETAAEPPLSKNTISSRFFCLARQGQFFDAVSSQFHLYLFKATTMPNISNVTIF